jgi:predicted RecA/RadA family phage recombinase
MSKVVRAGVEERRENAISEARYRRWHHKTHATRNLGSNSKVGKLWKLAAATESVRA